MRINHNIAALNTYRQLNSASTAQGKSMEKLSSGLRINKAGDDAAGLAISEKMRGQIRGLDMASRNAQDAISLTQTAEGALNETHDILQRMRELAVQASNDTNTGDDRKEIQKEINQLSSEVNRIGNTTEFNTQKLLNGDFEKTAAVTANVQGTSVGASITINGVATNGEATGAALTTLEIHSGKGESIATTTPYTTGADSGPNVVADSNELTVTINGTTKTVALTVADYSAAGDDGITDFMADIASKLNEVGAFGVGAVSVTQESDGTIKIATANATDKISVDGGNALTHLGTASTTAAVAANNTMDITLDGVTKTITLADNDYDGSGGNTLTDLASDIQTQVDTVFGSGKLTVTKTATDELNFESQSTGSNSKVSFSGAMVSTLGISSPTTVNGTDNDTSFDIKVDGETVNVNLSGLVGSNDSNVFAAQLQNSINTATSTAADVKVSFENGKLNIQSGTEGLGGSISITDNGAAKSLGLSTSNGAQATAGADEANSELTFQIGANQGQSMSVVIGDMRSDALGITASADNTTTTLKDSNGKDVTVHFTKGTDNAVTNGTNNTGVEYALDVSTAEKASAAILAFDKATASVSSERSRLGSYQNRLEHTINNLNTSSENLTAAESRVRDVDMAKEMMTQTKNSILSQAAQAMLAQANQQPQGVLQLLR